MRLSLPLSFALIERNLILSGRLGPVVALMIHRVPDLFGLLHAATVSVRDVGQEREVVAAGGGLTRRRSLSAAVGEAMERLSLRAHRHIPLTSGPFDDPVAQLDPSLFLTGPKDGVPGLGSWQRDDDLLWMDAQNLRTRTSLRIPAFTVFPSPDAHTPDGRPLCANTSTGGATARTLPGALLAGLYEVIERDAFTAHWENRWPGVEVPLSGTAEALAKAIERFGCKVAVRALASDTSVPVALAAIRDTSGIRAAIAFGASARATWEQAAFRAIEEALLTSMWITNRLMTENSTYQEVWQRLSGLPEPSEHAFLYGFPDALPKCAFLFGGDHTDVPHFAQAPTDNDTEVELWWLAERVESVGGNVVFVDITHPAAARLNLIVTRVVIAGFLALSRGGARPLTNPRLTKVAERLGRPHLGDIGFNPDPHPFP